MKRHFIWYVSFLEADCKTCLARHLKFTMPDKILDLARRGDAELTELARGDLQRHIDMGRGAIWLNLREEQYRKLQR